MNARSLLSWDKVRMGHNVDIIDSFVDVTRPDLVTIGNNVTITGSMILTHDASTQKSLGFTKTAPVVIGSDVFIGHGSIILPGVTIGNNVTVGAGSVVRKDIPDDSVVTP